MEEWTTNNDFSTSTSNSQLHSSTTDQRDDNSEMEVKNPIAARKVQKADREKLRRDKLNEQFLELGNTLDPVRPKNDKATILTDTIQIIKDLTAEVNMLKADSTSLSEESRELVQEKNELREEKTSLKSDIENLNVQYQQRLRIMFPWGGVEAPVVMAPPPYSFTVAVPVPPGPIPMHPSLQPFPYYGNQNPAAIPNPCSTFIQYPTPTNHSIEQQSTQYASSSLISSKKDSRSRSSNHQKGNNAERSSNSNEEVATDLELKMPGSSTQQDTFGGERKGRQTQKKERSVTNGSLSSRLPSSQGLQDSSSNSVGDISKSSK
ncbi:hypothetical protein Ddye_010059 [Dipteronia dyeriana]|uniref:BHLH domain-containing protein n=1 Tax=Dipteronia dyeriana TaxID=168575 RepID=A0AAD9XCX1_9ROSI|nr:hypothetical protein Ddye_010059 [Dipteronia dyeriana]